MRLLLDTHTLLWWLADNRQLSPQALTAISDDENLVAVSAATAWEISIKRALGKLRVPEDLERQLDEAGFQTLSITVTDALAAGQLPRHHEDPFDRMLVAQARHGGFVIVSRDSRLRLYDVPLLEA